MFVCVRYVTSVPEASPYNRLLQGLGRKCVDQVLRRLTKYVCISHPLFTLLSCYYYNIATMYAQKRWLDMNSRF